MIFVSATGTEVGKTAVSRGIARAWARRGPAAALKPFETGVDPVAMDARSLARACGRPELASHPGFYRAKRPLAPWAATLEGEAPPDIDAALAAVRELAIPERTLVEGAGGVLVPMDAERTMLDVASALGAHLLLVAADTLGVLSYTLTAVAEARRAGLVPRVVVLTRPTPEARLSHATNARILEAKLGLPLRVLPHLEGLEDDARGDDRLADAVLEAGIVDLVESA
ncbi:MAG: dethiobiotin synthase [Myxococcota bacterium]